MIKKCFLWFSYAWACQWKQNVLQWNIFLCSFWLRWYWYYFVHVSLRRAPPTALRPLHWVSVYRELVHYRAVQSHSFELNTNWVAYNTAFLWYLISGCGCVLYPWGVLNKVWTPGSVSVSSAPTGHRCRAAGRHQENFLRVFNVFHYFSGVVNS